MCPVDSDLRPLGDHKDLADIHRLLRPGGGIGLAAAQMVQNLPVVRVETVAGLSEVHVGKIVIRRGLKPRVGGGIGALLGQLLQI